MHTEKNIAEAIFGTLFNISEKTKDNTKARLDVMKLCDRPEQNLRQRMDRKKWTTPRARFVLTREQKKEILMWFRTLVFPDGYATNLMRAVNLDNLKLNGLKSHDWHIWLERLMPAMIRGYIL